jgi:beta-mannosidase
VILDTVNNFAVLINGKKVFCKGANWVPADAIYGRITDEKIEALVREARLANLNTLRIWGGGRYECERFYEECDRNGILVWHDFMFACAPYPDHIESFCDEIAKEADFQTRRLSRHACVAVWSGGNENLLGLLPEPGNGEKSKRGYELFGRILPEAVRKNCPGTPYWYNSPYGGDTAQFCSDSTYIGDTHFWRSAMMDKQLEKRIDPGVYDKSTAFFISEFGFPGPCSIESTMAYLNTAELNLGSDNWQHHSNGFVKGTIDAAIAKNYGINGELSDRQYLLYGGLVQGLMYGYSLEALRARLDCNGGIFWMYNDAWGEVGWSIMDYYLRRKISWYFVRRALAPQRIVMRRKGDEVFVTIINDSVQDLQHVLEYGYMSLDGSRVKSVKSNVAVPSLSRTVAARFTPTNYDPIKDILFARVEGDANIQPAVCKSAEYHQLQMQVPKFETALEPACDGEYMLEIASDYYAHAVQISGPGNALVLEDNYFDLLPNSNHRIRVQSSQKLCAKDLLVHSYVPRSVLSNQKIKISPVHSKTIIKTTMPVTANLADRS